MTGVYSRAERVGRHAARPPDEHESRKQEPRLLKLMGAITERR